MLLGVRSYTNLLFGHFATKLFEQHGITIHKGMPDGRRLSIQRLCKLLSSKTEAEVIVENLVDHNTNVILKLSRSELRAVCQSPFHNTAASTPRADCQVYGDRAVVLFFELPPSRACRPPGSTLMPRRMESTLFL